MSGSAVLTAGPPNLLSITVAPGNTSIALGTTQQFTATGLYSDGSTLNLTAAATWVSSVPGVTISNATGSNGLASTVAQGPATVTATLGAVSGSASLTVTPAVLVSIAITPLAASVAQGVNQQFTATGTFTDNSAQNITATVVWSSSLISVATISNAPGSQGLATSLAQGATNITATSGSVTNSVTLTVLAPALVSIAVNPNVPIVAVGTTQQFTASGAYTDGSSADLTASVTWSSSAADVASISNDPGTQGLASAAAQGSSAISATLGAVSGSTVLTVTPGAVTSISVNPPSASIPLGTTQQFTATGTFSDNSSQDLTQSVHWSAGDGTVATVSNSAPTQGLATPVAQGGVTVTASLGAVSGSASLVVTAAVLQSIALTPANPSVPAGSAQQFTATGLYSDGSTQDLTSSASWTSSTSSVATITSGGLASGVGVGTSTITATSGSVAGSTTITVVAVTPALVSIAIAPNNVSIFLGTVQQFAATGLYSDGSMQDVTSTVSWISSITTVATITGTGLASGVGAGTSTIAASSGAITGSTSIAITVLVPTLVSIVVAPGNASAPLGTTQQFTATGLFSDGSTQSLTVPVTWSSSSTNMTISNLPGSNGLATTVAQGVATITATLGAINGSTSLNVTPAALVSIAITPASTSIAQGLLQQFMATGTFTDNSSQDMTAAVVWGSSSTAVATISNASGSQGLATGVALGSVTLSASLGVTSGSAQLVVVQTPGLTLGTYFGAAGQDLAHGIAVDSAGSIAVCGYTNSPNFPTKNAFQATLPGKMSAFVSEFNPDGTLAWSTFLGGSNVDKCFGIAVDAGRNVYVVGTAMSSNFPTTPGVVQPHLVGRGMNAFVTKFSPLGAVIWSTYVGSNVINGNSIAVDLSGDVWIAGDTRTSQTSLPDGYVAQLNSSASQILFSAAIGGSGTESVRSIAVLNDQAYIAGYTNSADFPATPGAFQTSCGGACSGLYFSGFVAELGSSGVVYASYLGGSTAPETLTGVMNLAIGIAVDAAGNAYVTGTTNATDFPVTPGAFQQTFSGVTDLPGGLAGCIDFINANLPCGDAFVTKINPFGSGLVWSSYLGGSTADIGYAVQVDPCGRVWVGGYTQSYYCPICKPPHTPFPTTANAFQSIKGGGLDAFLSALSPDGSTLIYSTYYGGSADEEAFGLAVDSEGNGYLAGRTISANTPVTSNAHQATFGGAIDAFVARITP